MAVRVRDGVPPDVVAALVAWLPYSEFATSLRKRATRTIAVGGAGGDDAAVLAVVVEGQRTLSGAPVLVACAAGGAAVRGAPDGVPQPDDDVVEALGEAVVTVAGAVDHVEVVGPAALARPAADRVAARWAGTVSLVLGERLLVAEEVVPAAAPGRARRAAPRDRDVLEAWLHDFAVEALAASEDMASRWATAVDDPDWDIWVWDVDGAPVSLVNHRRTTPVSSRVAPVYTPPEQRGNGYAAALTAAVTEHLLDGGDPRVVLFTDATNATSNALYARIGYRDVGAEGSWEIRRP